MSTGPVAQRSGKKRCLQSEEDLLPDIFNDITLNKITPKLSWRDFYTLSSVSRAWHHAVRSRQVYNESYRSHSTEPFVLGQSTQVLIALYSIRENSWYNLPPIPDVCPDNCGGSIRIPEWSQSVSLDGKVYVLGGLINSESSNRVFAFDVAGGGRWKRCSSMTEPRARFRCAVKDGKIYVCCGRTGDEFVTGSEVYDPKEDAWYPIKPMAYEHVSSHDRKENYWDINLFNSFRVVLLQR